MQTDPRLDEYIAKSEAWQAELSALRDIVLHSGLDETIKWNKPCYTFEGGNLIAIARLKEVVLLFRPVCSLAKVDQGFISGC